MCAAASGVCAVITTTIKTYFALVHLIAHSCPTKRCCGVCKMQCDVVLPQKIMLNTAPRDAASATALLNTVNLHATAMDKYNFTAVHRGYTHADERDALQCRRWCVTMMVVRWTARSCTLQWCYQSLNQIVPIYTHTVHYTLHITIYQHLPPHHHTLLLWGGNAGWND